MRTDRKLTVKECTIKYNFPHSSIPVEQNTSTPGTPRATKFMFLRS